MPEPTVSLRRVTKAYRHFTLDRIDLDIGAGRIAGLIGPNGAGKSTLFRILMGLVRPDAGHVRVLGRSMPGEQAAIKRLIGYVSEDMRLHPSRSLHWHAELVRSFHPTWDVTRARELAGRFELHLGQRAGELSRGQTVKAMLLFALSLRPRLLLLDEPTAGLDPLARIDLLEELVRIARNEGLSVLFSSHLTGDLELLADDIVLLHAGRLIEAGPRELLLGRAVVAGGHSPGAQAPGVALDSWFRRRVTGEGSHAV